MAVARRDCADRVDLRDHGPPAPRAVAGRPRADPRHQPAALPPRVGDVRGVPLPFRAMVWRRILMRFGHRAARRAGGADLVDVGAGPLPARRHLAGRRPRVPRPSPTASRGSHCSASQILELAIFLLANLLVARRVPRLARHQADPTRRPWLVDARWGSCPCWCCCFTRACCTA